VRSDVERLTDIIEAADRIALRVARGRPQFNLDEDIQLALVRLIEIVGEACANVSADLQRLYPNVPWRAAASMRNRVIHGYFDVDLNLVWTAAAQEIPELARDVQIALTEIKPQSET